MNTTSDSFFDGIICGFLAADSGDAAKWSWRDFAVYVAAGIAAALAVGVPTWILCN